MLGQFLLGQFVLSQIGGPDWWVYLLTFLVGVGAGVLSALLGVGGAVVTTPAIRVLGATPILAVGSTVPAILPAAISGTWRYAKAGLVDWRAALGLGISGAVFAVGGAMTSSLIDGRILMLLTAFLMFWSGISVVRGGRGSGQPEPDTEPDTEPHTEPKHSLPVIGSLGAASGFVAGLLGVGGGIIMVPVLTGPLKIPMKSAVASSLVAVAIFSIPALVTHIILGHVDWAFALPLMLGVIPGAQIGARITIGSSDRSIRLLFGALIIVLALVYGISEALAFF
ncbi:MAG: TSUP family transporter [Actinobacteria bacterium]|nr:TSUP family transporter [Actinomycetota bacterium]